MTAKKKVLAKNPTALAKLVNQVEGLYAGATGAEIHKAIQVLTKLERAIIINGDYLSLCLMIRRVAKKGLKKGKK